MGLQHLYGYSLLRPQNSPIQGVTCQRGRALAEPCQGSRALFASPHISAPGNLIDLSPNPSSDYSPRPLFPSRIHAAHTFSLEASFRSSAVFQPSFWCFFTLFLSTPTLDSVKFVKFLFPSWHGPAKADSSPVLHHLAFPGQQSTFYRNGGLLDFRSRGPSLPRKVSEATRPHKVHGCLRNQAPLLLSHVSFPQVLCHLLSSLQGPLSELCGPRTALGSSDTPRSLLDEAAEGTVTTRSCISSLYE